MRRRQPALLAGVLVSAVLTVAGCTGGGSTGPDATARGAQNATDSSVILPTVTGAFGARPALKFPASGPPTRLATQVVIKGAGRVVSAKDVVVADYLGQVWRGAVVDTSFDTGTRVVTKLSQLTTGWAQALTGQQVGSRVLLSLPPSGGSNAEGKQVVGVSPTDTVVFVVDIVEAFGVDAAAQVDAVPETAAAGAVGPQVSGALGGPAGLTLPQGVLVPADVVTTVLATGTGAPVKEGKVIGQYAGVDWTGTSIGSSWQSGTPEVFPVAPTSPTFAGLIGVPLGSRVLLQVPPSTGPAVAVVIDLVAQP